jgi:hypothetical protein
VIFGFSLVHKPATAAKESCVVGLNCPSVNSLPPAW